VLLRFVDVSAGTATFNGIDLRCLSDADVRSAAGGLVQDAHIFDSTIRANLLIGAPGATDAELAAAAGRVRLLDWITSLPAGLAGRGARRPAVGRPAAAAGAGPGRGRRHVPQDAAGLGARLAGQAQHAAHAVRVCYSQGLTAVNR
jgi:hypothetical protein